MKKILFNAKIAKVQTPSAPSQNALRGLCIKIPTLLVLLSTPSWAQSFDVKAAYAYIQRTDVLARSSQQEVLAAKENYMSMLDKADPLPAALVSTYIALYENKNMDIGTRHYAVQHMRMVYERQDVGEKEKAAILSTLWSAAEKGEGSIPGTALLQLRILAVEDPTFDTSAVKSLAVSCAADSKADQGTRISALQVAAMMGAPEIESVARSLANDTKNNVNLRLSAIGALGVLGDSDDKGILDLISKKNGEDSRLKAAASEAIEAIDENVVAEKMVQAEKGGGK